MSEFSKTLAIIGILAPLGAGAMGIGDIRSHSALNQTLNAEIPLVLSRADKLDTIQVRLASPEAFDKAGVERLYALTQLRFRPVAKHDGRYAIQVSSNDVIQEPFLDFLVEVESPQGKLLREFTLLLDPPGGITQAATGQISTSDLLLPRHDAEFDDPASYNPPPPPARATPGYAEPYLQDEAPSRPAFRPAISLEQLTGQTYGPVRRRETLFEIASRVDRPHSVTAGQMATALYLANPRAFSGNIHGLRAGSILRIPTEDFIASVGPEGTGGTPSGSKAMGRPRPDYDDSMARNQSSTAGKATAPYQPPRGYSFGAGVGSADGAGAVAEVSSRVPSALKKENEELRERLTQLEQQLEEAQRMLVLKNAELASLQSHQSHPAESDEPAQPAKPALPPASNESARAATPAETSAPAPVASVTPVQSAAPSSTIAPLPKPTVALMPTENPSAESPMVPGYWLASGGLILLGLGAWLFRRRLGEVNTILRGGIAQEPTGEGLANPVGYSEPGFELSGDLDTATLDPQWEANVYLRYGRYPQAESLIREAIKQAPEQHDLKLKLFEIFIHANNPDAFRAYAREIQEGVKHLPVTFWSTVHAMRPEWLPPEITSEVLSAPAAADSAVAASSAHAPPVQDEADALDIEDTDFTAELRALEAQYAEPERQHPDTESADTAPTRAKELALELTGDESGAGDTQAFTPPALASPTGTSSTDSVAAAGSESRAVLPADILADSDTDFTEALRALEAQYEKTDAVTAVVEDPGVKDQVLPEEEEDSGGETPELLDKGNLLKFVSPSLPDSEISDNEASLPNNPELTQDNLIPFDTSGLSLGRGTLSPGSDSAVSENPAHTGLPPTAEAENIAEPVPGPTPVAVVQDSSFGALDFDLDLYDPGLTVMPIVKTPDPTASPQSDKPSVDKPSIETLLDLARTLADQGDKATAREALQTVLRDGDSLQKAEAETLLYELGKVRLSLVPTTSRGGLVDADKPLLPKVNPGV